MSDEALRHIWQEASLATFLERGTEDLDEVEPDAMDCRDLIILLDISYRLSGSDLKSFLGHFELPSVRKTSIHNKRTPFQAKLPADSTTLDLVPMPAEDTGLRRSSSAFDNQLNSILPSDSSMFALLEGSDEYMATPSSLAVSARAPPHMQPKLARELGESWPDITTDGLREHSEIYGPQFEVTPNIAIPYVSLHESTLRRLSAIQFW